MDRAERAARKQRRRRRLAVRSQIPLSQKFTPSVTMRTVALSLLVGTTGFFAFIIYWTWWAFTEGLVDRSGHTDTLTGAIVETIVISIVIVAFIALWINVWIRLGDEDPKENRLSKRLMRAITRSRER